MAYSTMRQGVRGPKDYTHLTPFIHEVNREVIRINEETKKQSVHVMNKVVEHVVGKLKKVNEPFRDLYKDIRKIGSFFDGTKITAPSEYDVYIVLQFPSQKTFQVQSDDVHPGFVTVETASKVGLHVESGRWVNRNTQRTLNQMVDENGYVQRNEVLNWWKSNFTKAIPTSLQVTEIDGENYALNWFNSESGIKVHVKSQEDEEVELDIDMIPVLRFRDEPIQDPSSTFDKFNSWAQGMNLRGQNKTREWYIFPKPLQHNDTDRENRLWGLSFTDQEKIILKDKYHLKPVIRLLKRLRDKYAWKQLTSYCIRTIFLHNAHKQELPQRDLGYLLMWKLLIDIFMLNSSFPQIYWNFNNTTLITVVKDFHVKDEGVEFGKLEFLSELEGKLLNQELPGFWDDNKNLFAGIKPETLENIRGFVSRSLKTIHRLLDDDDRAGLRSYVRKLFIKGDIEEDEEASSGLVLYRGATYPSYSTGSPYGRSGYGSGIDEPNYEQDIVDWGRLGKTTKQEEDEGMSGLQKALIVGGGAALLGGVALALFGGASDPRSGSGSGGTTSTGRSQRRDSDEQSTAGWGNQTREEMSGLEKALLVGTGAAVLGELAAMFFTEDDKKRKN